MDFGTISIVSHASKIMLKILTCRLESNTLAEINMVLGEVEVCYETMLRFYFCCIIFVLYCRFYCIIVPVSYTHLTLPTNREV